MNPRAHSRERLLSSGTGSCPRSSAPRTGTPASHSRTASAALDAERSTRERSCVSSRTRTGRRRRVRLILRLVR
eukprot:scaffold4136_cov101-Isochrysis_galbana.AAC.7